MKSKKLKKVVGRTILHFGRKAPNGFKELPGGIHVGKGMWLLPIQKVCGGNYKKVSIQAEGSR